MTDDRDDAYSDDSSIEHGSGWDAALNGALTEWMFGDAHTGGSNSSGDTLHAAFDALLFGDRSETRIDATTNRVRVWVANDTQAPSGFGRIMLTREVDASVHNHLTGVLDSDCPQISANAVIASGNAANDNSHWIGSSENIAQLGVYGRDPSVAVLDNGDALIAWIGTDHAVHARFLPSSIETGGALASADRGKLDHLLAGLGEAATDGKAGRVVATPIGQNSVALLWTYEFALNSVLMGKILTLATPTDGEEGSGNVAHWTTQDITPTPAPLNAEFTVALADVGTLAVTFDGDSGETPVSLLRFSTADIYKAHAVSDDVVQSAHSTPPLNLIDHHLRDGATGDPAQIVHHEREDSHTRGNATSAPEHHETGKSITITETVAIAGDANDTIAQTTPSLTTSRDGEPTAMYLVPGASDGAPSQVLIASLDEHGHAKGASVVVTDQAMTSDAGHPSLDVGPAITGTNDGVAVVWVEQTSDGATTAKLLQVQAYDDDSNALCDAPVTVTSSTDPGASYSDVSVGYTEKDDHSGKEGHDWTDQAADQSDGVLAVAWVENASSDGYGLVKAQFFAVDEEGQQPLTALGADGLVLHDNDAPFDVSSAAARAPEVQGLGDGALAIAWVDKGDQGANDVIRGVIYTPGTDVPNIDIDLSSLMPQGVASGTDPILESDADGDLIVGWIQAALTGGFEAASAIYKHGGEGKWVPPTAAEILNHFDNIPHDFAIAVSGKGDDMSLVLAWRDENNTVTALQYDVDKGKAGPQFTVYTDTDHNDSGGLGLTNTGDGQLLIVYASNDGHDSDISGALLKISDEHSGSDNSGSGSSNSGSSDESHKGSDGESGSPQADISKQSVDTHASNETPYVDSSSGHQDTASTTDTSGSSDHSVCAAVVDLTSDAITFNSSAGTNAPYDDHATSAATAPVALAADSIVPTAQDVAALETLATGKTDDNSNSGSSGKGSSKEASSSSSDSNSGKSPDSDGDGSHSGQTDANASNCSGSDNHSGSDTVKNDTQGHHDGDAIAIAAGYGNDVPDYISADDQAALVPEPISVLFEALQFANAFNDAANCDVLVFDGSNVATITQLKLPDMTDPRHDVPLI